jgi:hypothetical protein
MKRVRLPLDHLAELWPNDMKGARVGALLPPASILPGEVPPFHSRDSCVPDRLKAAPARRSRRARFSHVTDLLVRPYDLPELDVPRGEFGFYCGLLKR